jgi:GNAT superfamily N-acetyltransferase
VGGVIEVRSAVPDDREWIRASMIEVWATPLVAIHEELVDTTTLPALVSWHGSQRTGLLTYRTCADGSREVVSLHVTVRGAGVGRALLVEAARRASSAGAPRIWVVTTNDNTGALRFYQRCGWDLVAIHHDAVTRGRRLKPSIPLTIDGIAVRHELELELALPGEGMG